MTANWPCLSCVYRDHGFCAELLKDAGDDTDARPRASWQDFQIIQSGESIVTRGRKTEYLYIVCDGWAFQFLQLPTGRRQITGLFLPSDFFSLGMIFLGTVPTSVTALTDVRLSRVRLDALHRRLVMGSDMVKIIAQSCYDHGLNTESLLTAIGQLSSEQRLAFLFLHLLKRSLSLDAVKDSRFKVPLRQQHIAELLGLTPVHVNRVLRKFRSEKIAELSSGYVTIHNLAEIERLGSIEN